MSSSLDLHHPCKHRDRNGASGDNRRTTDKRFRPRPHLPSAEDKTPARGEQGVEPLAGVPGHQASRGSQPDHVPVHPDQAASPVCQPAFAPERRRDQVGRPGGPQTLVTSSDAPPPTTRAAALLQFSGPRGPVHVCPSHQNGTSSTAGRFCIQRHCPRNSAPWCLTPSLGR